MKREATRISTQRPPKCHCLRVPRTSYLCLREVWLLPRIVFLAKAMVYWDSYFPSFRASLPWICSLWNYVLEGSWRFLKFLESSKNGGGQVLRYMIIFSWGSGSAGETPPYTSRDLIISKQMWTERYRMASEKNSESQTSSSNLALQSPIIPLFHKQIRGGNLQYLPWPIQVMYI